MLTTTPNGLDEIIATFGSLSIPDFEALHIVPFTLPAPLLSQGIQVTRARCHHLIVDNFLAALGAPAVIQAVRNYGGIFNSRPIRGQPLHPSTHSWGIAIDLEPGLYPLGSRNRFPDDVVQAFHDAGFFYGGDFKSRTDPMHFQFATGY